MQRLLCMFKKALNVVYFKGQGKQYKGNRSNEHIQQKNWIAAAATVMSAVKKIVSIVLEGFTTYS